MTAHDIIRAMGEVYRTCRSYTDSGRVLTEFVREDGEGFQQTRPFRTAFVRPDRFRFQYSEREPHGPDVPCFVVALNGTQLEEWWGYGDGEPSGSLSMAVAGATGVSGGSAHTVPALLLPEQLSGRRLTDSAEFVRLEDGELDGVVCHRVTRRMVIDPEEEERMRQEALEVTGRLPPKTDREPELLWIDANTFLLRRIDEVTSFPDFRVVETTTYIPFVNQPVPEDLLRFDPPSPTTELPRGEPGV